MQEVLSFIDTWVWKLLLNTVFCMMLLVYMAVCFLATQTYVQVLFFLIFSLVSDMGNNILYLQGEVWSALTALFKQISHPTSHYISVSF